MRLSPRHKHRLFTVLAPVVASAIALGTVELVASAALPVEPFGRLPPGRYMFTNHEFVEHMAVNRFGLREAGFAPGPDTRRVLLLGDSFVEGVGLSDQETIAAVLNRRLGDRQVQVYNAGISGNDIADYATVYARASEALPPLSRVIVVVFIGNDFLEYERIGGFRRTRDEDRASQGAHARTVTDAIRPVMPGTLRAAQALRNNLAEAAVPPIAFEYTAATHIDWFNEHREYFGREPLTAAEERRIAARFGRIPADIRALIGKGLVNKWVFHPYVTEPMNDFVFNMNTPANEAAFASSMRQLDKLLAAIGDKAALVLIPDRFQVSAPARETARAIMGPGAATAEFENLLAVNGRVADWMARRHPRVPFYDATPDLLAAEARAMWYDVDIHLRPAGAALVASGIERALFAGK